MKGKRQVFRSISTRVHSRFNVSVAEIENNDRHTLLTLGVSCVSNNSRHANEVLSKVVDYIQTLRTDAEFLYYQTDIKLQESEPEWTFLISRATFRTS